MTRISTNKNYQGLFVIIVIGILLLILSYFYIDNPAISQNNQDVKYYKDIDKTHYYIQFVNEIPYFRVNRYNQYYEVIYVNDRISEALFYRNNELEQRWEYSHPEKGVTKIEYYGKSEEEGISEKLLHYEIYYYDMGLLIKKEKYSDDNTMDFYIEIDYESDKPIREYYLNSNDTYIFKYYFYQNDVIRYILRRGIVYNQTNNDDKKIINERWIYHNKRISAIEIYNGSNISEKYYFNQYGRIIKKEIYNELQRIDKFYIYEYEYYVKLSIVYEYETNDPNFSKPEDSNILKSYHFSNDKLIIKEYQDDILIIETIITEDDKTTERIYYKNGKLKKIRHYKITYQYQLNGYNVNGEQVIYTIHADDYQNVKLTRDSENITTINVSNIENSITIDIYSQEGYIKNRITYFPQERKLLEENLKGNTTTQTSLYFIMENYDDYITNLNLNPLNHIMLFPPDKEF